MIKELLLNLEESISRFRLRGITNEQLLIIKSKWEKKNQLIQTINQLNEDKNRLTKEGKETASLVVSLNQKLAAYKEELTILEKGLNNLVDQLPNLPAPNVPTNEEGNRLTNKTDYPHNIQHNLTYEKILKKLNLIDEEKSILLSGSKFAVYQGVGSQLLQALINFMLAENSKRGYQLFTTPYLVNADNLYNTGQFHKFQDSLYKIEGSNFYLLPTAEVSLVNLYQKQILAEKDLPLNLCAYSPCFRAERMAAGQENKGLIRLHQFHKVELVKIVKPEHSYLELEKLVSDARNILHLLKIPHRVIELCHTELGFSAAKTYDIEVLLPKNEKRKEEKWLEVSSCSNCEDFQSRRAQIRVKTKNKKKEKYYPHTLNGSALAIDRLIIVLCEYYYQEKENKLEIPEALKKYFF